MSTTFPCTGCGACCSAIEGIDFLEAYNHNGVCMHLQNKQCVIYENRPLLCKIDKAYEDIFSQFMSKEVFYEQNAAACNELQRQQGIDEKYRVKLK